MENLAIGDTVQTHNGGTRQVLWVGRQSFEVETGVADYLRPVRISTGALGDGLPRRDLVVTVDHALLLDEVLVNASALVNGKTITFDGPENLGKRFTVYHIETEDHAMILAEGCAAETYLDATARAKFDNYDEYLNLYGRDRHIPVAPVSRHRVCCLHALLPRQIWRLHGPINQLEGPMSAIRVRNSSERLT